MIFSFYFRVMFKREFETYELRTQKLEETLKDMKNKKLFVALDGWRNEKYDVKSNYYSPSLLKIERSAVGLFGILAYGCNINGYIKDNNGVYKLWIAKRAKTKQTFPGYFDNMVCMSL